ncbi:MAG: hypothetical protein A2X13_01375 [Bacteroidetes bacterium GWC2_33_15]|nr:MAG: hypothetical protein A2X10_08250 [Bacteroidetes bacterium GWA2_33_15]OFX52135.1 MAG: hypothetical protein A2X13_01375 [Bacteroidetes bacterium GWC2_33_15]OFX64289.1 MAG: hypothetical protein A2X15_12195 [Bacteroidetes bacterium GWB2_32_14]OFX67694.1 MAG: hypothetical protein A2X14_06020 [Bacteroidetes bacterium GWD2_33_33]HAN19302.1 SusD/RagB family nutrient-binding outer membrane lipoprotein [Bacteroidales bacterium]
MKKFKILLTAFLVGLLAFVGCDSGFEEINKNPNEPTVIPSDLLTADIVRNVGNTMYSTFVGGDMGSCWSQQWAKVNYEDEERYDIRETMMETIWKSFYEDGIADAVSMEKLAKAEGNDISRGVAVTMQAYTFSLLTELFGNVPFSEAIKGEEGNITPVYDAQEDIYDGIFALLDSANIYLAGSGSLNATTDLIYGGDVSKWQKFANSLKFRLLMRISGKRDVSAELQDIVSNRAIFTSSADDASLKFLTADPNANPIYESIVFGNRKEYKINSVMVDMLVALEDPRLPVYAELNNNDEYRGKPSGIIEVPNDEYNYDNVSAIGEKYVDAELPGFFMTYSELQFLMAEARHKNLITTGTAIEYYNNGVLASFEFNEVEDEFATYIVQPSVAYNTTSGLQKIAEQNWIAMYCQGVESWTEWRRTGFPELEIAIEHDPAVSEIPSRYIYPIIEKSVNATNYNAASDAMGGDLLTTKFWWLQ